MKVIRIGRDANNDYVISDPAVSGYHADLYIYDNGAMQLVEHSKNGMYVDQNFIHNGSCYLSGNEMLTFPDRIPIPVARFMAIEVQADTTKPEKDLDSYQSPESIRYEIQPAMGMGQTLGYFFNHYVDFNGRARRQEYWLMCVWNLIFGLIPFVNILYCLVTLLPGFALSVRRLHDTGKSGFWLLILIIPIIGWIIIFVWECTDSDKDENQYGPSPKYKKVYSTGRSSR